MLDQVYLKNNRVTIRSTKNNWSEKGQLDIIKNKERKKERKKEREKERGKERKTKREREKERKKERKEKQHQHINGVCKVNEETSGGHDITALLSHLIQYQYSLFVALKMKNF